MLDEPTGGCNVVPLPPICHIDPSIDPSGRTYPTNEGYHGVSVGTIHMAGGARRGVGYAGESDLFGQQLREPAFTAALARPVHRRRGTSLQFTILSSPRLANDRG